MAKLVLKEITNFKNLGHKNSSIYQKQHSFISFNTYLLGQLYARHYHIDIEYSTEQNSEASALMGLPR